MLNIGIPKTSVKSEIKIFAAYLEALLNNVALEPLQSLVVKPGVAPDVNVFKLRIGQYNLMARSQDLLGIKVLDFKQIIKGPKGPNYFLGFIGHYHQTLKVIDSKVILNVLDLACQDFIGPERFQHLIILPNQFALTGTVLKQSKIPFYEFAWRKKLQPLHWHLGTQVSTLEPLVSLEQMVKALVDTNN